MHRRLLTTIIALAGLVATGGTRRRRRPAGHLAGPARRGRRGTAQRGRRRARPRRHAHGRRRGDQPRRRSAHAAGARRRRHDHRVRRADDRAGRRRVVRGLLGDARRRERHGGTGRAGRGAVHRRAARTRPSRATTRWRSSPRSPSPRRSRAGRRWCSTPAWAPASTCGSSVELHSQLRVADLTVDARRPVVEPAAGADAHRLRRRERGERAARRDRPGPAARPVRLAAGHVRGAHAAPAAARRPRPGVRAGAGRDASPPGPCRSTASSRRSSCPPRSP